MVLESLEEHLTAKRLLADLDEMEPTDDRFDAKVMVLIEQVRNHVSDEESDLFLQVRSGLNQKRLNQLAGEATAEGRAHESHVRLPQTLSRATAS